MSDAEINRAISEINRAMGRIEASTDNATEALKQHKDESREGRAKIYKEIETTRDDLTARLAAMSERLDHVTTRLNGADQSLREIENWRQRFIGMGILLSIIWATIGGLVVAFWKWIVAKVTGVAG